MPANPTIEEFYLGEPNLEAYYTTIPCSAMAIQPLISRESKRARGIEAYGYHVKPPIKGRRECYAVDSFDTMDEISIAATRRGLRFSITVEEINEVKNAYIASEYGDAWWIAYECRQHVHLVIAILRDLESRGELPHKEIWGP